MCIRFGVYWPKGNIYIEDAFKVHVQEHAPRIMKLISKVATPGLQKYINGQVTKLSVGRPLFTNYVQMWWDDEEAMKRYLEAHQVPELQADDFANMVEWAFTAFVEEEVIFEKK